MSWGARGVEKDGPDELESVCVPDSAQSRQRGQRSEETRNAPRDPFRKISPAQQRQVDKHLAIHSKLLPQSHRIQHIHPLLVPLLRLSHQRVLDVLAPVPRSASRDLSQERRAVDCDVRVFRNDVVGESEGDESRAETFGFVRCRGGRLDVGDPESLDEFLGSTGMSSRESEAWGEDAL